MDPFDMLPHEMWEAILARIEDPLDKLSLIRSNSSLELAFQSYESTWQFAAVVPILMKQWYGEKDFAVDWIRPEQMILLLHNKLALYSATRNFRMQNWLTCKAIDSFIDEHWKKFGLPPLFTLRVWYSSRQIMQFMEQVADYPANRNPILSQSIFGLCSFSEGSLLASDAQMLDLLGRVGRNMRGLVLAIDQENIENPPRLCHFIQESLTSASNIQSMILIFMLNGRAPPEVEVPPAPQVLPLPDLPNLDSIYILDSGQAGPSIPPCVNLKKYLPQLKMFCVEFSLWKDCYNYSDNGEPLFLKLEVFHLMKIDIWNREGELFKLFNNLNAPRLKTVQCVTEIPPNGVEPEVIDKAVYFIRRIGLFNLKERLGDAWNARVRRISFPILPGFNQELSFYHLLFSNSLDELNKSILH